MAGVPDWIRELCAQHAEGIGAIDLFRGVDASSIIDAVSGCEVLDLPAGTTLLRPGEANDIIYVLLSGQLAAHIDSAHSPDNAIPIRPGESVGEMSVIDGKPVSALVAAAAPARVLVLPSALFWSRLAPLPGVSRNLLTMLSERMRRGNAAMLEAQRKQLALEYLRQELQVARQLQASMIPLPGRLFPEREDIEVAGIMEPASDVGGDFFDAFFVDETHLFLCVGDVSGHGIPAALFMARTIGLIRIAAMATREPDRLLQRINEELCIGNDANIFVTLFCGFLDVVSGRLVHANGGHGAPLVARAGKAWPLPIPKGSLLGVIPGLRYQSNAAVLEQGAALICYTDGVTEAESDAGEEFSAERLISVSAANSDRPVEELLDAARGELDAFIGHRTPDDDCTLLAVRRPATP